MPTGLRSALIQRIRTSAVLLSLFVLGPGRMLGQAGPAAEAKAPEAFLAIADEYRVPGLEDRRFTHEKYWEAVGSVLDDGETTARVSITELGRSLEGRSIQAVTLGEGPVSVLLWSQMHGDESTASMSLADITHWWAASPEDDPLRRQLAEGLTVTMIPMLNPDGAERFMRYDALGVDVNRDARRLATPEARILKAVRDSLQADFGFNLHDQGSRTAGQDGKLVGIALLAPAADEERSWGPVRQRARRLSGVIAAALQDEIPGRIARYDDSFTPRAFGDNMQRWGTSTVLIESGALPDDPQKQELRRLNVLAILAALESIADGSLETASTAAYDDLPMNVEITNDLVLLGGRVVMGGGAAYPLDVAIVYDDAVARTGPRYGEIGDLTGARALETMDVTGLYLHPELDGGILRRGGEVRLSVRRGADPASELVRRIPELAED
ncbi:MAG TPA: M14 family zinc carboxypeptidase [Gemmatimonadota bacterium]|nr:M14 family zinc carboxypeptidase [Gemmatimonadota bacterium]